MNRTSALFFSLVVSTGSFAQAVYDTVPLVQARTHAQMKQCLPQIGRAAATLADGADQIGVRREPSPDQISPLFSSQILLKYPNEIVFLDFVAVARPDGKCDIAATRVFIFESDCKSVTKEHFKEWEAIEPPTIPLLVSKDGVLRAVLLGGANHCTAVVSQLSRAYDPK